MLRVDQFFTFGLMVSMVLLSKVTLADVKSENLIGYPAVTFQSVKIKNNEAKRLSPDHDWMVIDVIFSGLKINGVEYNGGTSKFSLETNYERERFALNIAWKYSDKIGPTFENASSVLPSADALKQYKNVRLREADGKSNRVWVRPISAFSSADLLQALPKKEKTLVQFVIANSEWFVDEALSQKTPRMSDQAASKWNLIKGEFAQRWFPNKEQLAELKSSADKHKQSIASRSKSADEEKRLAEAERLAEEQRKAEAAKLAEAERLVEEQRKAEAAKLAEAERLAEEQRKAEAAKLAEAERLAQERRKQEAAFIAFKDNAASYKASLNLNRLTISEAAKEKPIISLDGFASHFVRLALRSPIKNLSGTDTLNVCVIFNDRHWDFYHKFWMDTKLPKVQVLDPMVVRNIQRQLPLAQIFYTNRAVHRYLSEIFLRRGEYYELAHNLSLDDYKKQASSNWEVWSKGPRLANNRYYNIGEGFGSTPGATINVDDNDFINPKFDENLKLLFVKNKPKIKVDFFTDEVDAKKCLHGFAWIEPHKDYFATFAADFDEWENRIERLFVWFPQLYAQADDIVLETVFSLNEVNDYIMGLAKAKKSGFQSVGELKEAEAKKAREEAKLAEAEKHRIEEEQREEERRQAEEQRLAEERRALEKKIAVDPLQAAIDMNFYEKIFLGSSKINKDKFMNTDFGPDILKMAIALLEEDDLSAEDEIWLQAKVDSRTKSRYTKEELRGLLACAEVMNRAEDHGLIVWDGAQHRVNTGYEAGPLEYLRSDKYDRTRDLLDLIEHGSDSVLAHLTPFELELYNDLRLQASWIPSASELIHSGFLMHTMVKQGVDGCLIAKKAKLF
jgi:hypothetical protein